jgi:hypothetical protein
MIRVAPLACVVTLVAGGVQLETHYAAERAVKIEVTQTSAMSTTTLEMERDGEPVEGRGMGGGMSSKTSHHVVQVDRVVASAEGRPTKVRRTFETLEGESSFTFGEEERKVDMEAPLKGVTLELTAGEGGEVTAEVVDGDKPSDNAMLEGHKLGLALDALLPGKSVDEGATWELDADAARRALGLDVNHALFARPAPPEDAGGGDSGGGGRRRGGRMGGGGMGGEGRLLQEAKWEGKATLKAESEDHEGVACAVVEIELTAEGEMAEPERGSGGGRRRGQLFDQRFETEGAVVGTNYAIKLEGKLYFAIADKRPVGSEIEGTLKIESETERQMGESTFRTHSVREGTFTQKVAISKAE